MVRFYNLFSLSVRRGVERMILPILDHELAHEIQQQAHDEAERQAHRWAKLYLAWADANPNEASDFSGWTGLERL